MLLSLHVKNLALIDETEVNFDDGFNVLSGETGAGKSLIIGSINLALGDRAGKELIRNGAEYALVELIFAVTKPEQERVLKHLEIPYEEGTVFIQRKILPNRSINKVCGETVTVNLLREVASAFIDIHGQHEHQSLLYKKKHLIVVDEFCKEQLEEPLQALKEKVAKYHVMEKEIEKSRLDDASRKRELALAEYESTEIEEAMLVEREDDTLEEEFKKLSNGRKIDDAVSRTEQYFNQENGILDLISKAFKEINQIDIVSEQVSNLQGELVELESLAHDFSKELYHVKDDNLFDEERLHEISERLDIINYLKTKYGLTITEIINHGERQKDYLEKLQNLEQYCIELQEKKDQLEEEIIRLCETIHDVRVNAAKELETEIIKSLEDLNFLSVQFEIKVSQNNSFTDKGYDDIEFLISTNPGEPLKPLSEVASGGELSRIMLALKTVLAKKDKITTLIFDEIDSGISGKTAWKVSEQISKLSKNHQIICITHLPQIAAMADTHFRIEKEVELEKTTTKLVKLSMEETIEEISRLLGGDLITENVRNNAIELKDLARKTKSL